MHTLMELEIGVIDMKINHASSSHLVEQDLHFIDASFLWP